MCCDGIVTKDEWVIEGISLAGGRKPLQLHAECFHLWERERHLMVGETTFQCERRRLAHGVSVAGSLSWPARGGETTDYGKTAGRGCPRPRHEPSTPPAIIRTGWPGLG